MSTKYVVTQTVVDSMGRYRDRIWGPFSEHRALIALDVLRECDETTRCEVVALLASSDLDAEYPATST